MIKYTKNNIKKSKIIEKIDGHPFEVLIRILSKFRKNTPNVHDAKVCNNHIEQIAKQFSYLCTDNIYVVGDAAYDSSNIRNNICLLYTSPSPRDRTRSRMPSSA